MLSSTEDSLGWPSFCRSCSILALVKVNANHTDGSLLSSQCSDHPANPPLPIPQHRPLGSRLRSKHHPAPHRALQMPGELVTPAPQTSGDHLSPTCSRHTAPYCLSHPKQAVPQGLCALKGGRMPPQIPHFRIRIILS